MHTIVLPHATAYNRAGAPAAMARIARALEAEDAAEGLFDLAAALGARQSLAEIGLRESDLDRAADLAVESPYPTRPRSPASGIRALLDDAFHGDRPAPSDLERAADLALESPFPTRPRSPRAHPRAARRRVLRKAPGMFGPTPGSTTPRGRRTTDTSASKSPDPRLVKPIQLRS